MALEVLIREIQYLRTCGTPKDAAIVQIDQSLIAIFDVLLELIDYYPPWHKSLTEVISDRSQCDITITEQSIQNLASLLSGVEEYDTI